jgi:hypothetical protein
MVDKAVCTKNHNNDRSLHVYIPLKTIHVKNVNSKFIIVLTILNFI